MGVLARSGFDRATVDEIVREAGFSKGAFYVHFETKEDLFWAMLEERISRQQEAFRQAVAHTQPLADNMRMILSGVFGLLRDDPLWGSLYAEFAAHAASAIPFLNIEPLPDFTEYGPVEKEQLRSIRRKVARKMVTSMVLIPHVAHMDEADVTLLEDFRKKERQRREGQPGGRLTLLAFVVKAVTAGLRTAPRFNASLDPFKEEIIYKKYYNIGIAVDSGRGLVVPVIKETDRKSIIEIAADIEDLARRGREGKLEVADMRGGTFTITNIGVLGGTGMMPTINYPEVAILGMGGVQEKPVVRDGEIVIRKMLPLTLAFDHRIADGADAARFVSEMVRQLSDPNLLLLET